MLQPTAAPEWLIQKCGTPDTRVALNQSHVATVSEAAVKRAVDYLKNAAPVRGEGERNHGGFAAAAMLKDIGIGMEDALILLDTYWQGAKCIPALDDDELTHVVNSAYKYGREEHGAAAPEKQFTKVEKSEVQQRTEEVMKQSGELDDEPKDKMHPLNEMNKEYAFVIAGGGHNIIWETKDEESNPILVHLAEDTFHKLHGAKTLNWGDKPKPLTKVWMTHPTRRTYNGICFAPEQPVHNNYYNLWRGFAVSRPSDTSKYPKIAYQAVDKYIEHIEENVCRGDAAESEWLLGWLAHLIQRPWEKTQVAVVMKGKKGTGKNVAIEHVGHLLGGHFMLTAERRYLVGNFNSHIERCLLFGLSEAFWSGDKAAEGVLKELITGTHHLIERKGREAYRVKNLTRIAIFGNEDWIIPATQDERRFAVFELGTKRQRDIPFFVNMQRGMEQGGYELLFEWLHNYDVDRVDVNIAPMTSGLREQKRHTLDLVENWWATCLEEGTIEGADFEGWPSAISTRRFRDAFENYARSLNNRSRLPDKRTFGRKLNDICPAMKRVQRRDDGAREWQYDLPELQLCNELYRKWLDG